MKTNLDLHNLLKSIPDKELENITIKTLNPETIIIKKGAYPDQVFIVIEGVCSILKELNNGNIYNIYKIKGVDIIGFSEILNNKDAYIASVETRINTTVGIIPREVFLKWITQYNQFTIDILLKVSSRLHTVVNTLTEFSTNSAYFNVISYLIDYCHSYKDQGGLIGNYIKIEESRHKIAEKIGVNIRTVNRIVKELKEEDLIRIFKGKIYISETQLKLLEMKV